jgi:AraC-like DNA-binding protein
VLARFERRVFREGCKVWIAKYRGLHNIPHWHFENELIACSQGSATVNIDGDTYNIKKNMCVYLRSEIVHYIKGSQDSNLIVAQYDNALCAGTARFYPTTPLFYDNYNAYRRMNDILKEMQARKNFFSDNVNSAMSQLIVDIFRGEELATREYSDKKVMSRYKDLLEVIDSKYDSLTFKEAAVLMNMSEANFSRSYKKTFGINFSSYINVIRISKAIEIMNERPDITMVTLMMECGFNTLRNFNRVFKEITGYPPSKLPPDFVLNLRSLATDADSFDPTLEDSVILP